MASAAKNYWDEWPTPANEDDPLSYATRFCLIDLKGFDVPAILGLEHTGYRRWRAVSFDTPEAAHG